MTLPGYSFFIESLLSGYHNRDSAGIPSFPSTEEVFASAHIPTWEQSPYQHILRSEYELAKNRFQVNLNVKHFAPEDVSVKTADGFIFIIMKHEGKKDSRCAWESCELIRKFQLPEGCDAEDVQCRMSPDKLLTVFVPSLLNRKSKEREVPIVLTDPLRTRSETRGDVKEAQQKPESADEESK